MLRSRSARLPRGNGLNKVDEVIRGHVFFVRNFSQSGITKNPGSYGGQLGAGDTFGSLTKFANAVWRLCDSSTSGAVAVVVLYVPKRMGTMKW